MQQSTIVQTITVLGATGSIGRNTLDVIARHPQRYRVFALTAHQRVAELLTLCVQHRPQFAVVNDERNAQWLRAELKAANVACEVLHGVAALEQVAAHPDAHIVMAAIVGAAGLLPTLAAVRAGKRVLLANKEALVMSGQLFMDAVQQHGATLLPIDSEHNAIWQCLPVEHGKVTRSGVKRIVLTGSGGPFLQRPLATLESVTPDEACAHPNWSMGRKISVDSATMMNKGLELIEACWLFACAPAMVDVVLHPQSVIHSMVEYVDGSMIAQLGNPDMRTPIAYALAWPERIASGVASLDLVAIAKLEFLAPDLQRFPCLKLAMAAAQTGGSAPAILNAANEVAVQAFLEARIPFTGIAAITAQVMEQLPVQAVHEVGVILDIDRAARECAQHIVKGFSA